MTPVAVTVIIPWRDRPELEQTLRENAPLLRESSCEILVVNCGGEPDALRALLDAAAVAGVSQIDIPSPSFNKSLALNVGIHHASHDVLLLLDADILLTHGVGRLADACTDGDHFVVFNGVVERPAPAHPQVIDERSFLRGLTWEGRSTFIWADGTSTVVRRAFQDLGRGSRLGPGLMLVKKSHLIAIGGFCSNFQGWGWEDVDVHLRLQRVLGLTPLYVDDQVIHLSHQDHQRDVRGAGRRRSGQENFLRGCEAYAREDFSGSYANDLRQWLPATRRRIWTPARRE